LKDRHNGGGFWFDHRLKFVLTAGIPFVECLKMFYAASADMIIFAFIYDFLLIKCEIRNGWLADFVNVTVNAAVMLGTGLLLVHLYAGQC
jgi:hypothetical protein